MKIVLSWLQDFLNMSPGVDVSRLTAGLIQLGHEVDEVKITGGRFAQVVVGRIISREPHPNADRLGVCQVDVGEGALRQIVCGAPNARTGLTVAVALPGAALPVPEGQEPFRISKGVIRGVESNGMICSRRELALGTEHEGIWEMQTGAASGTPLGDVLGETSETVLDISITPNRGDCLSHLGMARELAMLDLGTLQAPGVPQAGGWQPGIIVKTETKDCLVLHAVVVRHVRAVSSPDWVQRRLQAAGIRPRTAVVDATNYVMLALGQPLHAYDAAKIGGGLVAREGRSGGVFVALNDAEVVLEGGETVICAADDGRVLGLGGIIGGRDSMVTESTRDVVLEAAWFDRGRIALSGQAHGLHTDARARFERGVDPQLAEVALKQCAAYIAAWCNADDVQGHDSSGAAKTEVSAVVTAGTAPAVMPGEAATINYDPDLCRSYGGLDVPAERQAEILNRLGFATRVNPGHGLSVNVPSWRTTMQNPEDLVEEVLRVTGYDSIPSALPPGMPGQQTIESHAKAGSRPIALDRLARRVLAANGVLEVMTYSFIGQVEAGRFAEGQPLLALANPLAETSMTTMRPSLLPGLLRAWQGNLARGEVVARLGEVGKVYGAPEAGKGGKAPTARTYERNMAAVLLTAGDKAGQRHWQGSAANGIAAPEVFAAKGLAEALLEQLGAPVASLLSEPLTDVSYYHPGRSGSLRVGPFTLARFGELHPALLKALDLAPEKVGPVAVLELFLEPLLTLQHKPRPFQAQTYPAVRRDFSFLVDQAVGAAAVQATLQGVDRALVRTVDVFDLYGGNALPAGKKALSLSVRLQADDRTLTEADIQGFNARAVAAVAGQHGGEVR